MISTSSNNLVTFSNNDEIIFSDEQKEYIISKFPDTIQDFLRKVKNPLDEKEVIINMFKDKNVRIIIKYEKDFMDDYDWVPYFHCQDVANVIGYRKSDINRWNERWKFNLIPYEKLLRQIGGATQFMNFEENRTDKNALFIGLDDLKEVLIKINTDLSNEYKKWIMKQSAIMSKFLKYVIQIKNEEKMQMMENKIKEIEDSKQKEMDDMKNRALRASSLYPIAQNQEGYVYIATSKNLMRKGLVRIGHTLNVTKRESTYQSSDPEFEIKYYRDVKDQIYIEKTIHYMFKNIRKYSNREYFYFDNLDKLKEEVDGIITYLENLWEKQEEIIIHNQNLYIDGKIEPMDNDNMENEMDDEIGNKIIRKSRSVSPKVRQIKDKKTKQKEIIEEYDEIEDEMDDDIENKLMIKSRSVSPKVIKDKKMKQKEKIEVNFDVDDSSNTDDSSENENLKEIKEEDTNNRYTKKECDDDDYNNFLTENVIRQQKLDSTYNKLKKWCVKNNIIKIPTEKIFIENVDRNENFKRLMLGGINYIKNNNDKMDCENDVETKLRELFIFTNDAQDLVPIGEVNDMVKHVGIATSTLKTKFNRLGIGEYRTSKVKYYTNLKIKQQV